jgi:hypothetical protein
MTAALTEDELAVTDAGTGPVVESNSMGEASSGRHTSVREPVPSFPAVGYAWASGIHEHHT